MNMSKPLMRGLAVFTAFSMVGSLVGCSEESANPTVERPHVLVIDDGSAQWPDSVRDVAEVQRDSEPASTWLSSSPNSVSDRISGSDADLVVVHLEMPSVNVPEQVTESALRGGITAGLASGATVMVVGTEQRDPMNNIVREVANQTGALYTEVPPVSGGLADATVEDAVREYVDSINARD